MLFVNGFLISSSQSVCTCLETVDTTTGRDKTHAKNKGIMTESKHT